MKEIVENSGLLCMSEDRYLFVHRTLFEYFVSCRMHREKPTPAAILELASQPRWEEPLRLFAAQIESGEEGTAFFRQLWDKDRALALRCYADMAGVVEQGLIRDLLYQAEIEERVALVRGLPEKVREPEKIVETLRELFNWESNGEVLYWGVEILEKHEKVKDLPGAKVVAREKLDKDAAKRYRQFVEADMVEIPAGSFMMGDTQTQWESGYQ